MSTAPISEEEQGGILSTTGNDGLQTPTSARRGDVETTPKSEVAPLDSQHKPSGRNDADAIQSVSHEVDYFTLPTRVEAKQRPEAMQNVQLQEAAPVETLAEVGEVVAPSESTGMRTEEAMVNGEARPNPQTLLSNLSLESNGSAITVTPIRPAMRSGILQQQQPVYPDQSYAALQDQRYPQPHLPPLHRHRTAHQSHILTFTSALASTHQSGSRTAASSPAITSNHGLFNPYPSLEQRELDSAESLGTYASPFLHFTHRQVPKETHVADVDRDTVSGRKIINHYEIVDELGRGTHGKVKLGRDLNTQDTFVAIKIVERYSKRRKLGRLGQAEDKVKKEVAILKKARHPHIVALLEVIDDPSRKKVYIVLELVANGEINWRAKTPFKEIAILEARRYERERNREQSSETEAEEQALLAEVQHRLTRRARHELRKFRKGLRDAPNAMGAFSYEMVGDHDSGEEDDDRSSRVSATTASSIPKRSAPVESRLPSRPETPVIMADSPVTPASDSPDFLPLTPDVKPLPSAHVTRITPSYTGLEGTMYGAYDNSFDESCQSSSVDARPSPESLAQEILDTELNTELEYVPVMTIDQARGAFRDTLLGLQYLHSQGIVHRDIKPPNLLSTKDHRVKISDFGVSYLGRPIHEGDAPEDLSEHEAQELDEAKELARTVGTPAFYAPELCITEANNETPLPVTKAIDVWAFGITLFCMIFARTPFVDTEYVVMRYIADEEIYIPRKRLKPVVLKSPSHPASYQRLQQHNASGRRLHGDIVYEDIDESLHDLMRRLLIKDPRRRITLEEVRHHPWVLQELPDKAQWLEETDPARSKQSQKIEVSKEDVNTAVVPLQFLDRVRSGIKKVGERLGLSGKSATRPRTSSNASAGLNASPPVSTNSSCSNISQDVRRQSLRGDESIFSALQRSREMEHPLSKSVAASPDLERREKYFDATSIGSDGGDRDMADGSRGTKIRPLPERSKTVVSTAGSVRTLKQVDVSGRTKEPSPPSPGLPSTPIALDSPGGSSLGAIFGTGPARRAFRTLRERSSVQGSFLRASPRERASADSFDAHGGPSLAISTTSAEGHVNLPDVLQDLGDSHSEMSSLTNSPVVSRIHSGTTSPHDRLQAALPSDDMLTRASSASSLRTDVRTADGRNHLRDRSSSRAGMRSGSNSRDKSEEKHVKNLDSETEEATAHTPDTIAFRDRPFPPSPDDLLLYRVAPATAVRGDMTSEPTQNAGTLSHDAVTAPAVVSSSSEFGSAVSMSVSDPSAHSAISEISSLQPHDILFKPASTEYVHEFSDDTLQSPTEEGLDSGDEGYQPDLGSSLNSDEDNNEDDESSDSDDGLVMTRRRSKLGISRQSFNPHDTFQGVGGGGRPSLSSSVRSKKSSRSGSNNTMKEVRTRDSEDGRRRRSLDIKED